MKHPYLFFSECDIPELRARLTKEPFLTKWNLLVEDAENILTATPDSRNFDRMSYRNATVSAFAYIMTRDMRYARRAIDEVLHNFTIDVEEFWQFNSVNCKGAGLGTSNYSISCGIVYDWCYDVMTDDERVKFKDGFENIVNDLYLKSLRNPGKPENSDWWVFRDHSNWCGVCHAAQGIAALAFYDESVKARRSVRYASEHIPRFIRNNLDIDGGAVEGVMYARYGIEFAITYLVAECRFFGYGDHYRDILNVFNERLAGYWDIYMLAPDNCYANFGNVGEKTMQAYWTPENRGNEGPYSSLHAFFESLLPDGDPLLRWASDVGGSWFIWRGVSPFYFIWRKDDNPPSVPLASPLPMELQDAVLFRETGHASFRKDRLWLAFNGGLISPDSHFNRDLGSFILFYDDVRFTSDPGYGDSETWQHSTLLINGLGQMKNGRGKFLYFDKGDDFYYLACELSDAYMPDAGLLKFIRHIVMINGKYVLMIDETETENPAEIEWLLQTRKSIEINDTNSVLTDDESGKKMYIIQAIAEQPVESSVTNWKKAQDHRIGDMKTLHIKPKDNTVSHTFVTLFYPDDSDILVPEVIFSKPDASITVAHSDGITDIIKFTDNGVNYRLDTVNGKMVSGLMNPNERSVIPFRDKNSIDIAKMPRWILGTY